MSVIEPAAKLKQNLGRKIQDEIVAIIGKVDP
jgi:hypothetical protein